MMLKIAGVSLLRGNVTVFQPRLVAIFSVGRRSVFLRGQGTFFPLEQGAISTIGPGAAFSVIFLELGCSVGFFLID